MDDASHAVGEGGGRRTCSSSSSSSRLAPLAAAHALWWWLQSLSVAQHRRGGKLQVNQLGRVQEMNLTLNLTRSLV